MLENTNAQNSLEIQIYHMMGIKHFRNIILWFEKIRHYRDTKTNENYHPSNFDVITLERHNGFLLYNAFLHVISLVFTLIYAFISTALSFRNIILDLSMILLTLLNVYCFVLQRTNYLKLRELRHKYYNRFLKRANLPKERILQKLSALETSVLQTDYEVLLRMRMAYEGKKDCILTCDDTNSLKRISSLLEPASLRKTNRAAQNTLDIGVLDKCKSITGPYTKLQLRADCIQRMMGLTGRKMLDRSAIITEDAECELLYRKIVPQDTAYNYFLICFLLYDVFLDAINKVESK